MGARASDRPVSLRLYPRPRDRPAALQGPHRRAPLPGADETTPLPRLPEREPRRFERPARGRPSPRRVRSDAGRQERRGDQGVADRALQRFRALRSAAPRRDAAALVRPRDRSAVRRRRDLHDRSASRAHPAARRANRAAADRPQGRLVMTTFLVFAGLMIAAALAFVLVPLLRHARSTAPIDDTRRLRALDEALASGVIDADEYATKRAALANKAAQPATTAPRTRATFAALLAVALVLPAAALLLYRLVGAPEALDPANLAPPPEAQHSAADMEKAIA